MCTCVTICGCSSTTRSILQSRSTEYCNPAQFVLIPLWAENNNHWCILPSLSNKYKVTVLGNETFLHNFHLLWIYYKKLWNNHIKTLNCHVNKKLRKLNTIRLFCAELSVLFKVDDLYSIDKGICNGISIQDQFTSKLLKDEMI